MNADTKYIVQGGDGCEYGPVTGEQVRDWVRRNRADAQTQVRREGESARWRLRSMPEFADVFPGAAGTPPVLGVAPGAGASKGSRVAWSAKAGGRGLAVGSCFGVGWEVVRRNFGLTVGAAVLVVVLHVGLMMVPVVGGLAAMALSFVLYGGLGLMYLKLVRGERAELSMVFAGFGAALLPLVVAGVIAHVFTAIGFVLCVLPAIYLLVAWWLFTPLLVLDRGMGWWEALECSRKVVTSNWWACLGLTLLCGLVLVGGTLAMLVGLVVAVPWVTAAIVAGYEQLFGMAEDEQVNGAGSPTEAVAPAAGGVEGAPSGGEREEVSRQTTEGALQSGSSEEAGGTAGGLAGESEQGRGSGGA